MYVSYQMLHFHFDFCSLQSVSVSVSVLTLTFISIDRWYAICHPLQFKSTASRAKKAIVIIWCTSLVLVLPDAIVMDTRRSSALRVETHYFTDCTYTWGNQYTKIYQLLIVFFLYFAPFLFMSFFYYQIVKVLWNKNIPGSAEVNSRQIRTEPNDMLQIRVMILLQMNSEKRGQAQAKKVRE
ncbi:orexin receptor type 2 [Caerostris darwini]|uniref:Orexin receptor type 2 n=1 Tax=Caerostris darwini TaxID=1538125 RepID=A0AAV4WW95_9ARAC|nr:orexin receptor type 2 [Caerostris darwini]